MTRSATGYTLPAPTCWALDMRILFGVASTCLGVLLHSLPARPRPARTRLAPVTRPTSPCSVDALVPVPPQEYVLVDRHSARRAMCDKLLSIPVMRSHQNSGQLLL